MVINDIAEKFLLCMGHKQRVCCQKSTIKSILEDNKENIDRAHIIIDFKMNYESCSSRESSMDHFGKRGMAWHGVMIVFFVLARKCRTDGSTYFQKERRQIHIDQILNNGNKKDAGAVIDLLEVSLVTIITNLPHIKEVYIQSDNAACYQGSLIILACHYLNMVYFGKKIYT